MENVSSSDSEIWTSDSSEKESVKSDDDIKKNPVWSNKKSGLKTASFKKFNKLLVPKGSNGLQSVGLILLFCGPNTDS